MLKLFLGMFCAVLFSTGAHADIGFECRSIQGSETERKPDVLVQGRLGNDHSLTEVELLLEDLADETFHSFLKRESIQADAKYRPRDAKMAGFRRFDLGSSESDDLFEVYLPKDASVGAGAGYFSFAFDRETPATRELSCTFR